MMCNQEKWTITRGDMIILYTLQHAYTQWNLNKEKAQYAPRLTASCSQERESFSIEGLNKVTIHRMYPCEDPLWVCANAKERLPSTVILCDTNMWEPNQMADHGTKTRWRRTWDQAYGRMAPRRNAETVRFVKHGRAVSVCGAYRGNGGTYKSGLRYSLAANLC